MIKFVSVMFYHYMEDGPALAVSFDKDIVLTEEEFGRTVSKIRFIDWADRCRSASARLLTATSNLAIAEELRISATQKFSAIDELIVACEDEDEKENLQEEESRLANEEKLALEKECNAQTELDSATANFRNCGANLSDCWK